MLHLTAMCTLLQMLPWGAATFLSLAAALIQDMLTIKCIAGCLHEEMSPKLPGMFEIFQPSFTLFCCTSQTSSQLTSCAMLM